METVKGILTAVSKKDGKYGVAIGKGNWYNGFGEPNCNKGDEVEITYEQNQQWKNVKEIKVLKSAPEEASPIDKNARLRRITDCVDMAVKLCVADKIKVEDITEKAIALHQVIKQVDNE